MNICYIVRFLRIRKLGVAFLEGLSTLKDWLSRCFSDMSEDLITHYIYLFTQFSKNPYNWVVYFYQVSETRDSKKENKGTHYLL